MAHCRRAAGLLLLGLFGSPALVPATVFVTTRLDDAPVDGCATNGCTLREAVIAANGGGGPHRVELGVRGRYELTIPGANENAAATGDLDLLVSMEIGPPLGASPDAAAYVVDANGIDRVMDVRAPGGSSIVLRGMTLTGGSAVRRRPCASVSTLSTWGRATSAARAAASCSGRPRRSDTALW